MYIPEKCMFSAAATVIRNNPCVKNKPMSGCVVVANSEVSKTWTLPPSRLRQVVPTSGPIRGSTTVTVCGRNFGFDKTESFKTSLVTVEVGGAPCKLPRQDYVNRCVVCVWLLFRSGCSRREGGEAQVCGFLICLIFRIPHEKEHLQDRQRASVFIHFFSCQNPCLAGWVLETESPL